MWPQLPLILSPAFFTLSPILSPASLALSPSRSAALSVRPCAGEGQEGGGSSDH